jgi:small-conductance mechanosensitive channel
MRFAISVPRIPTLARVRGGFPATMAPCIGLGLKLAALLWIGILCFVPQASSLAASPSSTAASMDEPAKIRQLVEILADPAVQDWLKKQQKAESAPATSPVETSSLIAFSGERIAAIREHFIALTAALPLLPAEFSQAGVNLTADLGGRGGAKIFLLFGLFLGIGLGAEALFRRVTAGLRRWAMSLPLETVGQRLIVAAARLGFGVVIVAVFGFGSVGTFLALDWPPMLQDIVLGYLMALLVLRMALVLSSFLLAPPTREGLATDQHRILPMSPVAARYWHRRIGLFVGWFAFGWATAEVLTLLGFDRNARELVAYALGLGLLAIGLEMAWRRPAGLPDSSPDHRPALRRRLGAWVASLYFAALWLLWVASAMRLFWLVVVVVAVPWTMSGSRRAVAYLLQPKGAEAGTKQVPTLSGICLQRGLRAAIVIAGAFVLAHAWGIDLVALTSSDTMTTRVLRGLLSAVVIALLADLGWQLLKTAIDLKIGEAPLTTDQNSPEWRRQTRMRTLLPIFRNFLFVLVLVVAGLMILASLGIEIGPLIAGASVLGVAIGFGSQTLVRDVISGMFYLLDDAFRVGEYIQSGNYKGTVESFSLRSVKLRHHRGPLYTVPFGVLGAVENMSRDWVIDKLAIGVTYDTDLGKVKKIIKDIGKKLAADPEFSSKIMDTLKMQGVEQFGDFAIQIRMKMMTLPGENFAIRRRANAMIKEAFDANGIKFAFPTVQVAGGADAATAASAHQLLSKPAEAAG